MTALETYVKDKKRQDYIKLWEQICYLIGDTSGWFQKHLSPE